MKSAEIKQRPSVRRYLLKYLNGYAKYIIFFLAAASCAYGVFSGEAEAVLRKAAAICMECCGIG